MCKQSPDMRCLCTLNVMKPHMQQTVFIWTKVNKLWKMPDFILEIIEKFYLLGSIPQRTNQKGDGDVASLVDDFSTEYKFQQLLHTQWDYFLLWTEWKIKCSKNSCDCVSTRPSWGNSLVLKRNSKLFPWKWSKIVISFVCLKSVSS